MVPPQIWTQDVGQNKVIKKNKTKRQRLPQERLTVKAVNSEVLGNSENHREKETFQTSKDWRPRGLAGFLNVPVLVTSGLRADFLWAERSDTWKFPRLDLRLDPQRLENLLVEHE